MSITVECPECEKTFRLKDESAGKKFRCQGCGAVIPVPDVADAEILEEDDSDLPPEPPRRRTRQKNTTEKPRKKKKSTGTSPLLVLGLVGGVLLVFVIGIVSAFMGARPANRVGNVASTGQPASPFPVAQVPVPTFPDLGSPRILQPSGVRMWFVKMPGSSSPGQSMAMRLYLPPQDAAPQSIPCVLVAPAGTNLLVGNDMDADDYHAETLPYADAGMAVVFYSLDGGLASMDSATDAQFVAAYKKFRAAYAGVVNGRNALEFILAKVPQVNPRQIFTAGHSSAGTVSLLMSEHEPRLAGSIAYAPCSDVETRLADVTKNWLTRSMFPDLLNFVKQSSPKTHIAHVGCPVFLFHASDDSNVPVTESQAFAQQLKSAGKAVQLQTVPIGNHYDSMVQQGIPRAVDWLKTRVSETK